MSALSHAWKAVRERDKETIVNGLKRRGLYPWGALCDKPWMDLSWLLPGLPNRKVIRVFALRRSGHHAVLNWLRFHAGLRSCVLNDCEPGRNPFLACSRANSVVMSPFGEHRYLNWGSESRGRLSKKGVLIYNYEDRGIEATVHDGGAKEAEWLGNARDRKDIIVLRDPFNLFASKLRWLRSGRFGTPLIEDMKRLPVMWIAYAREFVGETSYLPEKICINFNRWFADRAYRDELGRDLGFENEDKGLEMVAQWGPSTWGDSFDGVNGNAREMRVLGRWKHYEDDRDYRDLFEEQELWDLSARIFGEIPGTQVLSARNQ